MKFGVIGYGSFGKLVSEVLSDFGSVCVYSKHLKPDTEVNFVPLDRAAKADVVILCVGLNSLDELSRQLAGLVKKDTLVVDVSSVKVKPLEILQKNLAGKCRILATHPLFGPQTVSDISSLKGENIVICPFEDKYREKIIGFLEEKLGLNVIEMSAEDHDKEMAWVHGLTFFVGRGLMQLNPPESKLATRYYQKLLDLVELESAHSIELFNTIEKGNPYAAEIRRKFRNELESIDKEIGASDEPD